MATGWEDTTPRIDDKQAWPKYSDTYAGMSMDLLVCHPFNSILRTPVHTIGADDCSLMDPQLSWPRLSPHTATASQGSTDRVLPSQPALYKAMHEPQGFYTGFQGHEGARGSDPSMFYAASSRAHQDPRRNTVDPYHAISEVSQAISDAPGIITGLAQSADRFRDLYQPTHGAATFVPGPVPSSLSSFTMVGDAPTRNAASNARFLETSYQSQECMDVRPGYYQGPPAMQFFGNGLPAGFVSSHEFQMMGNPQPGRASVHAKHNEANGFLNTYLDRTSNMGPLAHGRDEMHNALGIEPTALEPFRSDIQDGSSGIGYVALSPASRLGTSPQTATVSSSFADQLPTETSCNAQASSPPKKKPRLGRELKPLSTGEREAKARARKLGVCIDCKKKKVKV